MWNVQYAGSRKHHFFYDGGEAVHVPEHADVANAIGAVVGKVRVRRQVTVTTPRRGVFRVHAGPDPETVYDLEEARRRATEAATAIVGAEMVVAGAPDFEVEAHWKERSADVELPDWLIRDSR